MVDFDDLFQEKSLGSIFWLAPSFFSNWFNSTVAAVTAFLLAAFSILHIWVPALREGIRIPFAETFSSWAGVGASLAGTILGFLIAGFAILCTVLRPETLLALQKLRNKQYAMSELKLLFVVFVDVFVQYLALLFFSMLVIVLGGKAGPASMLGQQLAKIHWLVPFCLLHLILAAWGTWFIILVLTLKSFVYNLYESLLLALADSLDEAERQESIIRVER